MLFSFLDLSSYMLCIYIHKLSYIQRIEVLMNLHRACPPIKVKMSIVKDEGEAMMTDSKASQRFFVNLLKAASRVRR